MYKISVRGNVLILFDVFGGVNSDISVKLFDATEKLKWIKEGKEGYTLDQVIELLTETQKLIDPIMNKYDYSKLPRRN